MNKTEIFDPRLELGDRNYTMSEKNFKDNKKYSSFQIGNMQSIRPGKYSPLLEPKLEIIDSLSKNKLI